MLADIYQAPLPQKRLNCVLQFGYDGYVPPLKRVVMVRHESGFEPFQFCHYIEWASARVPPTPPIWGVLQREGER